MKNHFRNLFLSVSTFLLFTLILWQCQKEQSQNIEGSDTTSVVATQSAVAQNKKHQDCGLISGEETGTWYKAIDSDWVQTYCQVYNPTDSNQFIHEIIIRVYHLDNNTIWEYKKTDFGYEYILPDYDDIYLVNLCVDGSKKNVVYVTINNCSSYYYGFSYLPDSTAINGYKGERNDSYISPDVMNKLYHFKVK